MFGPFYEISFKFFWYELDFETLKLEWIINNMILKRMANISCSRQWLLMKKASHTVLIINPVSYQIDLKVFYNSILVFSSRVKDNRNLYSEDRASFFIHGLFYNSQVSHWDLKHMNFKFRITKSQNGYHDFVHNHFCTWFILNY